PRELSTTIRPSSDERTYGTQLSKSVLAAAKSGSEPLQIQLRSHVRDEFPLERPPRGGRITTTDTGAQDAPVVSVFHHEPGRPRGRCPHVRPTQRLADE